MNKKLIVGIVVGVAVVGGGVYYVSQNKDDNTSDNSTNQQTSTEEGSTQAAFDVQPTTNQSFVATISTTTAEGKTSQASMEYDSTNSNVRYTASSDDRTLTIIYTTDAYYMCQTADNCIKYPLNGVGDSGFDRTAYEFSTEKLATLKNTSAYQGTKDCPTGTCDVWKVTEGAYESTLYIDTNTKTIVQIESASNGTTSKIVYEYKDVSITPPANATEIPTLPQ